MIRIFLILTGLLYSISGFAQLFDYRQYTTRSGLVQSVVSSAAEDQFHQIWFSTYDGLSVFDGLSFSNLSIRQGLPVAVVINTSFFNNKIYSGLRGSLIVVDPETKFVKVLAKLPGNDDVNFLIPANGKIYFNSAGLLYQIENDSVSSINTPMLENSPVISILQKTGDQIFLADKKKLFVYDSEINFPLNPNRSFEVKNPKSVFIFNGRKFVYADFTLYELTDQGLKKEERFNRDENVRNIIPYNESRLIGFGNNGISVFDSAFTQIHEFNSSNGLISNLILNVFIDSFKNIWVLTEGSGIVLIRNLETLNFNHQADFKVSFPYLLINRSNSEFIIGAIGNGLSLAGYDGVIKQRWFGKKYVMAGAADRNKRVWFDVQGDGLYYMDRNNIPVKFKTPPIVGGNLRTIKIDSKNRIWMASNYGFYMIENGHLNILYDGIETKITPFFSDLDIIDDGTIVLASEVNGLFKYSNGILSHFDSIKTESPVTSIKRVFVDSKKRLLIASNEGVYVSSDYRTFAKIADSEKQDAGTVWGLMEDSQHRIWASASKGIFVIDPDSKVYFLNEDFGLNPSEFNRFSLMEDDNGYIWAGSVDNLIRINPDITRKIPNAPTLRIKNIITNSGFVDREPVINLKRDVQWIQFELGLSDFTAREKISFRYRILNRDTLWLPSTKNSAILIDNLSPGDFEIEFSAIDFLGRETNRVRSSFYIPEPYWKNSWLIFAFILILIFAVYNIYLYRLGILSQREKKLEELIKTRTQALESAKTFIENLIDSATEIIFTTDLDGNIQIWNVESANFFGLTKENILNRNMSLIDSFKGDVSLQSILQISKSGKVTQRMKLELKGTSDSYSLVLASSYPLTDDQGNIVSIVFMLTDLEQHRLLEAELLEKEKFIAGIEVLKNTLSTITHYVNNSITAIIGTAEMAQTKDKFKDKLVEIALNQSLEIRAVINSLENLNSKLDMKTKEYPDLTHQIFDIQHDIEMHLKKYREENKEQGSGVKEKGTGNKE